MHSILNDAVNFLKIPFNRFLFLFLLLIGLSVLFFFPESTADYGFIDQNQNASIVVHFFYHPGCQHCKAQMPFNAQLLANYSQIKFVYHDTSIASESELLIKYYDDYGLPNESIGVPSTFVGSNYIIGFDSADGLGVNLRNIIDLEISKQFSNASNSSTNTSLVSNTTSGHSSTSSSVNHQSQLSDISIDLPFIGSLKPAEWSLLALSIVLGLIDGFNPCAMWVLVYLISIVISLKDRSRLWLIVGSFVFASGVLYFLFMTAWLNAFLFVGYFRPVTIFVGLVALGGGILSLKEFIQNPKGTLECKVSDADDKKKTISAINNLVNSPLTFATILGVIVLAFTVNSIEFVCSAAIPAVFTQVLALSNLSGLEYYGYIFLYVFSFMLDDLLIFGLAAFAVSSEFGQKYAGYCHVVGGIIMFILGIVLVFFPSMLA